MWNERAIQWRMWGGVHHSPTEMWITVWPLVVMISYHSCKNGDEPPRGARAGDLTGGKGHLLMTLQVRDILPQIDHLANALQQRRQESEAARRASLAILERVGADVEWLCSLAQGADGRVLAAEPVEPLLTHRSVGDVPFNHTVVAVDGSGIDLDRHGLTEWFVINVGGAVLTYGATPTARLSAQARVYDADAESANALSVPPYGPGVAASGRMAAQQGNLFDFRRILAEQEYGLELTQEPARADPVVMLFDGTLIVWHFNQGDIDSQATSVVEQYVAGLRGFERRRLPVAGYISRPNSRDVTTLLGLANHHAGGGRAATQQMATLCDRDVFAWLPVGERSGLCRSHARSMAAYGSEQHICFFYLNVGVEVVRIELPRWVALDDTLCDLVQSVVLRQCSLMGGYPVVLQEAHEQAVVHASDRAMLMRLIADVLRQQGLPASVSEKQLSKIRRAV